MYKNKPNNFKSAVMNEVSLVLQFWLDIIIEHIKLMILIGIIHQCSRLKRATEMTLVDYYKLHHKIIIKDLGQPLLVHRSKEKTTGEVYIVFLHHF